MTDYSVEDYVNTLSNIVPSTFTYEAQPAWTISAATLTDNTLDLLLTELKRRGILLSESELIDELADLIEHKQKISVKNHRI